MQRFGIIGVVVIGAVLVAFALIYPTLKSAGEIATVEAYPRPMANGTAMGDPNAPVTIDVFEDFQCPACVYYTEEVERRITETYVTTGQVYYVFHHYPFLDSRSTSKESHQAANASMCAMEQGIFWEYHDILFANLTGENVGAYTNRRLQAFADALSLDMDAFNDCLSSNKFADRVQQDYIDGSAAGVTGTPAFVITYEVDGEPKQRFISGAYPFSEFQTQIEDALAEIGQ